MGRLRAHGSWNKIAGYESCLEDEDEHEVEEADGEDDVVNWVQCGKCDKWRKLQVDQEALDALADDWDCSCPPLQISCDVPEDVDETSETDAEKSEEP